MLTWSSKELSHELTSFQKQRIYITPNIVLKTTKTVHFSLLILSKHFCRQRNHLSLHMGLNHTVHTLMNFSPSWKFVFSLDQRFREINFHHLAMNSYLHQIYFLDRLPYYLSIEIEGYMLLLSWMYHVKWFDVRLHSHEYNKEN